MALTNRKGLPQIICDAVANDPYSPGDSDFTISNLLAPAFQQMLRKAYPEARTDDVADRLWAMYGSAIHYIIERAATEEDLIEERFYGIFLGKRVSAQIDHYRDNTITDWKLTGAYKIKKSMEKTDHDWCMQLNVQRLLMTQAGYTVDELYIGALCRDWSAYKHRTEEGYPDQIEYINIPILDDDLVVNWIENRIRALLSPEPCSAEERWQDPPKYALMKRGGTRAIKVSNSLLEVEKLCDEKEKAGEQKELYYVEIREAPNRRCEGYCDVTSVCPYYQANYAAPEELPFKEA